MSSVKAEGRVIERLAYRGFHGCRCHCRLEIIPLTDGRTLVIATELEDNTGTSITNVAEYLASFVCVRFEIDPDRLVWIEQYGYPAPGMSGTDRTFDLVTFSRIERPKVHWADDALRQQPDGWPGYFSEPRWRPMSEADWRSLGMSPRQLGFTT